MMHKFILRPWFNGRACIFIESAWIKVKVIARDYPEFELEDKLSLTGWGEGGGGAGDAIIARD